VLNNGKPSIKEHDKGVALYIITRVSGNGQKLMKNNLTNFTHIKVTALKNQAFHKDREFTE
jgi:hypothetical protein